jgi:tetratricopeptide (TPR) repeat protein
MLIMYSEIASAIVDKTQVNLTAEEMTRLTSASQVNPESYDAYIKGKSHLDKLNPEGLKIAQQYFDLALGIDPNNALAHVGISRVWAYRQQTRMTPRQEAMPLRIAALDKALELDNTLAEAYATLAGYRCWGEWDWENAEKEYQQALRLNPNHSGAHAFYSHFLCCMGRIEEALPHIELALELDPLNPLNHGLYGGVLIYNRRFDDALAAARAAFNIMPNHPAALSTLFNINEKGMRDELLAELRKTIANDPELVAAFEQGLEEGGYEGAQRGIAEVLVAWYEKSKYASAQGVARWYLKASDYDLAIDWLEKAYKSHEPEMPYIGGPFWDPLRSYPRFQDLLRKMNLLVDEKE